MVSHVNVNILQLNYQFEVLVMEFCLKICRLRRRARLKLTLSMKSRNFCIGLCLLHTQSSIMSYLGKHRFAEPLPKFALDIAL
jgi:hypothetical protein